MAIRTKKKNHPPDEKIEYKTETKIEVVDYTKWSGTVCVSTYSYPDEKPLEIISSVEVYNLISLIEKFDN